MAAGIVQRSVDWPWSSLAFRRGVSKESLRIVNGPVPLPDKWLGLVDLRPNEPDLQKLENCMRRGCPYGHEDWIDKVVKEMDLESTLRPRGRPKKEKEHKNDSWHL